MSLQLFKFNDLDGPREFLDNTDEKHLPALKKKTQVLLKKFRTNAKIQREAFKGFKDNEELTAVRMFSVGWCSISYDMKEKILLIYANKNKHYHQRIHKDKFESLLIFRFLRYRKEADFAPSLSFSSFALNHPIGKQMIIKIEQDVKERKIYYDAIYEQEANFLSESSDTGSE